MVDMTVSLSVRFRRTDSVQNAGWYTAPPNQTTCCGKRICEGCVERTSKPCPFCNVAEISSSLDEACVQWLGKYSVNCPNRSEGCKWEGQLADLDHPST